MAVSAIENISASGGKMFLQDKNENSSSNAGMFMVCPRQVADLLDRHEKH